MTPRPPIDAAAPSAPRVLAAFALTLLAAGGAQLAAQRLLTSGLPRILFAAVVAAAVAIPAFSLLVVRPLLRAARRERNNASIVMEHAMDAILTLDQTGRLVSLNKAAQALFTAGGENLVGTEVSGLIPDPEFNSYCRMLTVSAADGTRQGGVVPLQGRRTDGTVLHLEGNVCAYPSARNTFLTVVLRDVAARRRAEESLRKSEESSRALIENAPDALLVHRGGRLVFANQAALSLLQRTDAAELLGVPLLNLVHKDDRDAAKAPLFEEPLTVETARHLDTRLVRRDGVTVQIDASSFAVSFQGRPAIATTMRDVTERAKTQERLVLADRMVAMGALVAGVAHEIKDPLAYLSSNVWLLLDEVKAGSGARLADRAKILEEIAEATERIAGTVRELKQFSQAHGKEAAPTDPQQALRFASRMLQKEISARARYVVDLKPMPKVVADSGRLGQVAANLLLNAAQAINSDNPHSHEVRLTSGTDPEGNAWFEVKDNGCGIPAANLQRIFDPFFTTRKGVGTGLGLSISHALVKQMNGEITVNSEEGKGSTFRVTLYVAGQQVPTDKVIPIRRERAEGEG